jgi:hypothetical protein
LVASGLSPKAPSRPVTMLAGGVAGAITGWVSAAMVVRAGAKLDVDVMVVPAWVSVVSAAVLVGRSDAGWRAGSASPTAVLESGWTAATKAGVLVAWPPFWVVTVEWCTYAGGGVGDWVTSAAGWPDTGSAGAVPGGSPLAGALAAGPEWAGLVPTGPVALPTLANAGAEANRSSEAVSAVANGLDPL